MNKLQLNDNIKGQKAIGEYIGYSVPSVTRHKDKDRIPYFWSGHNICARSDDLDAWIDEQIAKEVSKHDGREEEAGVASDDVRDNVTVQGLREETPSVPRQLQRVRRVPQKIEVNQGRAVRG